MNFNKIQSNLNFDHVQGQLELRVCNVYTNYAWQYFEKKNPGKIKGQQDYDICSECQQDVKKSVRQTGRYTVTERQNDSMTVWQNSRAAKEPALVFIILLFFAIKCLTLNFNGLVVD